MDRRNVSVGSSLLEQVLVLASQRAQTLGSLSEALGLPEEQLAIYWIAASHMRRAQGHPLPLPMDLSRGDGVRGICCARGWYAPTWHLTRLLEEFQLNESLALHYGHALTDPEGGHYELNLAANEIVLAARLEDPSIDPVRMRRVCVQACKPENGIELLVRNAGDILLHIELYRREPVTPFSIESLYAKLVEGISIREVRQESQGDYRLIEGLRNRALSCLCSCLQSAPEDSLAEAPRCDGLGGGDRGDPAIVKALVMLHFLKSNRVFPAGNNVFAYLLYFIELHRRGYHFSAHVPVMKLLYAQGPASTDRFRLGCAPESLAVECDGRFEWTAFLERAIELIVGEQGWVMGKMDGMSRRRSRFRDIIDADASLNSRQKEVLLEAALHSNAEFTYAIHAKRYDVSYPCVRSDFARLLDLGFLRQHDDGVRLFFVAADDFEQIFTAYIREHCAEAFSRFYDDDGFLRDEFRGGGEIPAEYNEGVGFYEKVLLDKTYVEHYDFRRAPIADRDGSHERGRSKEDG